VFSILVVYSFGVRWFFGNEGNQPTFFWMKENNRGAQKGGEQISSFQPKKKLHCDDKITRYNNMMMIMRRDRSYYNQHVL
jgi:hypothetical protein